MDFLLNINSDPINPTAGDGEEGYTCGICCEEFPGGKEKVVLKCNPSHCFCYPCILDWYKTIAHMTSSSESNKPHTCPICRKDGGPLKLPIIVGAIPIYNVHVEGGGYGYPTSIYYSSSGYGSSYQNSASHSSNHCPFVYGSGNLCYSYLHGVIHIHSINKDTKICKHHFDQFRWGKILRHKDLGDVLSDYQKCNCFVDTENRSCRLRSVNKPGTKTGMGPNPLLVQHHNGTSYYMCKSHYKTYMANKYLCIGDNHYIHRDPTRPTITNHDQYVLYYLEKAMEGGAEEVVEEPVVPLEKATEDTLSSLDTLLAIVEAIDVNSIPTYQEMMKDSIMGMIHHLTKSLQHHKTEVPSAEEALPYTREEFFLFVKAIAKNHRCNVRRRDGSYCMMDGYFHCGGKCTTHKTKEKKWVGLEEIPEEKIQEILRDALGLSNLPCNVLKMNGSCCTKTGHMQRGGRCMEHWNPACRKKWYLYGGKVQDYPPDV